jgi:hypothetical protein
MDPIIDNKHLAHLKYNNAQTFIIDITYDMVNKDSELEIKLDAGKFNSNKILGLYWRFKNVDLEGCGFALTFDSKEIVNYRNESYFRLIVPYQFLPHDINDEVEPNDSIFMCSIGLRPTEVFNRSSFCSIGSLLELKIKNCENNIKINKNASVELVIQYQINPNNLPYDLEILRITSFDYFFDNLPPTLKKIIIYMDKYRVEDIKKHFSKIPFACIVLNNINQKIEID